MVVCWFGRKTQFSKSREQVLLSILQHQWSSKTELGANYSSGGLDSMSRGDVELEGNSFNILDNELWSRRIRNGEDKRMKLLPLSNPQYKGDP